MAAAEHHESIEVNDVNRTRAEHETASLMTVLVAAVVLLDQLTKALVAGWLGRSAEAHRWELAGSFLAFEYVENTGAAFGILAGRTWILSLLAVVVIGVFWLALRKDARRSRLVAAAMALVVAGALGNLIDRVRLGYVVDFLAVGIWPKFNLADCAITVGLCCMALAAFRDTSHQPDEGGQQSRASSAICHSEHREESL